MSHSFFLQCLRHGAYGSVKTSLISLPQPTTLANNTKFNFPLIGACLLNCRDLGTEGAEDADIALRKCISGKEALIPGPRYFCANRAIVSTGSYGEIYLP